MFDGPLDEGDADTIARLLVERAGATNFPLSKATVEALLEASAEHFCAWHAVTGHAGSGEALEELSQDAARLAETAAKLHVLSTAFVASVPDAPEFLYEPICERLSGC